MNNETAEILVGENVPFITGASTGAASSTGNPFQTIERKDIGVTLKVRPRINRDGSIDMSIEQTVESISPSAADAADIVTSKRRISTRVLIGDDEVLVLGGLMRDEFTQTGKGVPLLSRIPVLGRLFRSSSGKTLKKNLMVFIHPRILGSRVAAEALSRPRYERLQQEQRRFNAAGDELRAPGAPPEAPALPPVP
jgi:general secretion pathway protein D